MIFLLILKVKGFLGHSEVLIFLGLTGGYGKTPHLENLVLVK